MRKPVSFWAIALWIAAWLVAIVEFAGYVSANIGRTNLFTAFANIGWGGLRGALFYGGQLAGLGAIVESLDRLRWDLVQRRS